MDVSSPVFYRKYRPQTLQDVIGQEHIKEVLTKGFQEGKLSHAYLLCGPRGTGKTSTARIIAKMVNCTAEKSLVPCNSCDMCISVTDGSNLDLIEIDAASNRGIDDIRALRENIKLSPTSARKKVYIIDEVHMLTNEAFNALLKTLEEPPAHVLFVLATTEVHKIPQTILSRVQKLEFKLATSEDLVVALKKVVEGEKIAVDEEALTLIAKKGEGSFRDALKLLDQLASGSAQITVSSVEQALSAGNFESNFALLSALHQKDAKLGLQLVLGQSSKGINPKEFLLSLIDMTRMLMLAKHGLKDVVESLYSGDKAAQLEKLSVEFNQKDLYSILQNFQEALENLKFAAIPTLPLELAVVESCTELVDSSDHQAKKNPESINQSPEKIQEKNPPHVVLAQAQELQIDEPQTGRDDSLPLSNIKMVIVGQDIPTPKEEGDLPVIIDKWNYILETIRPHNFSLEALLRSVRVLECEGGVMIVEVPYSFHQRILETPKSRDLLESVVSDVLGKQTKVKTVIGKKPKRLDELQNVEIAADDEIIKIASEIFNSDAP